MSARKPPDLSDAIDILMAAELELGTFSDAEIDAKFRGSFGLPELMSDYETRHAFDVSSFYDKLFWAANFVSNPIVSNPTQRADCVEYSSIYSKVFGQIAEFYSRNPKAFKTLKEKTTYTDLADCVGKNPCFAQAVAELQRPGGSGKSTREAAKLIRT